jgi:SNF2 family DNA or RNA helicase
VTEAHVIGSDIFFMAPAAEAKALGARWHYARRAWHLAATRMNLAALREADPEFPDLESALVGSYEVLDDDRLYEYQREAAGRLIAAPHGMLVVLSPGLGKTAVAVTAADKVVPKREKVVVIAPASLLRTWEREIHRWQTVPGGVYIVNGKVKLDEAEKARWIVMSWDRAARIDRETWGTGWPLVILDESVLAKSRASKRYKAMKALRGHADRFWLLSGSPVTRYADDLWTQLNLLWPAAFPSYWRFAERYCVIEDTVWGKKIAGTRKNRDAVKDNSDLVMVVNQEDVLDLPEYLFEVVDVELTPKQDKAYRSMAKAFVAELAGDEVIATNEIARLQKLQQIASYWDGESGKHDALAELITTYEPPYLVWTHWADGAKALTDRLMRAGLKVTHISGETPAGYRDKGIEEFKAGDYDALVLSIGVGKFGHTLTNVKTMFYVDKTWNADDYFQSLHRVRRIGLTHSPVVVTIRAPGTVDELVEDNLAGKLGGISKLTRSELRTLLKGIGRGT